MSVGAAIYGKLTADLADTIGDRVFPAKAVQFKARPLVAYDVTRSDYDRHYQGASGLSSHDVTLSCVGDDYDSTEALALAVRELIDNGAGAWGGVTVQGCFVTDVGDSSEFEVETDVVVWQKDITLNVWIAS